MGVYAGGGDEARDTAGVGLAISTLEAEDDGDEDGDGEGDVVGFGEDDDLPR